ncbi:MAG: two-component system sensor histidine kinase CreC [Lentisphaerae bacterium]|nr:two-component system sensor histidine kinase CreC [Lentisphaerota bacterium]MBT4823545.1 two-component system sensor histidine kinase CreC [Lentisphaerota bacterium]MBT5606054.1 two-component system sensor histidine kinase CreC [Lentisphaerota bacterium]MBT7062288.1 two-component system sensor histidine kinase CreC [Lentisphaerota bacterium]MBT7844301.1 two-component system sensor histidine kinase CreC [Lentisphaerota bacterium]
MKIRTRIIIATCVLMAISLGWLVDRLTEDVRKYYRQAMEESLVDTSTLLSSMVAEQASDGKLELTALQAFFEHAAAREFKARIYELVKTGMDMNVYVTDTRGIVLFDSAGEHTGELFARWNDVHLTLQGEYGARSTRIDPEDPTTSVLHVASPILHDGEILGVLTVYKSVGAATLFIEDARRTIVLAGIAACFIGIGLAILVSYWITRPIRRLTDYAESVRDGERALLPRLGRTDLGNLAEAFEEMRDALEGRQYVEHYVQALTHEMKSPVAAIRGAAEILEDDLPADKRRKFLSNIHHETDRIQELVDRLLGLAAVETRKSLDSVCDVDLGQLASEVADSLSAVATAAQVTLRCEPEHGAIVEAEYVLLRQALANLVENAIEFCSQGGHVTVSVAKAEGESAVTVEDDGAGIPDYALSQVFERFYSLQRPRSGRKSTGIGLTFAREVVELHGGTVTIGNRPQDGAIATLSLPRMDAKHQSPDAS